MCSWRIRRAANIVLSGGVIAYPTEAVYGLGCNPYDARAAIRLLEIKQREPEQGVILVGSHLGQFADFIQPLDNAIHEKVIAHWPGPVTWLLPASGDCPYWLRGRHETIAVRVTAHELTRKLCDACDLPLVSTSANRHGKMPAHTALQVRLRLGSAVDMIVNGRTDGNMRPSEIWHAVTNQRLR